MRKDAVMATSTDPTLEPNLESHLTLPVLPVSSGVVFPEMVVTIRAETDDARRTLEHARAGDELVIVPRRDGVYARVGTLARIEQSGSLPDGSLAAVVRGIARVRIGQGVVGDTAALWVQVDRIDADETTPAITELGATYREIARELLDTV